MSARICTRSFASRFESGSSIRKTFGYAHDRAPHRDALALAAGQLAGLACRYSLSPSSSATSRTRRVALSFFTPRDPQREADVRRDRQIRVERVVLEDHRDVAVLRRDVGDVAVADEDLAGVDLLEPGEHAQRRRLARAGRADEHHELAVRDMQVERVHGGSVRARIDPRRVVEANVSHGPPPPVGRSRR